MVRKRTIALGVVGGVIAGFGAAKLYQRAATETVPYTVVARLDDVELRRYPESVVVETVADSRPAAFRRLFKYITGENAGTTEIEMTAPVELSANGATISMTAPVEIGGEDGSRMRFYLPAEYDIESAPRPTEDSVELLEIPERTVAVRRFSWRPTEARIDSETEALLDKLEAANVPLAGEPFFMGYDAPWTLPFLRRNEVAVEVESSF
ncbi:heme-binding protein [Natronomonas gomsonensis]|uniref:SOUL family heme-binding protein n=1 Tax=Natronomonas gomsonensis TaxID=1046043 RepID=UPI0015BC6BE2|nr:heme-binding protein [Natronomonas gomsonensis]